MTDAEKQEQIVRLTAYTKQVNTLIGNTEPDINLLAFSVTEILDRVRLYLNRDDVPVLVEKPLAKVIGGVFNKYRATEATTEAGQEISSVSDNGQSVSYSNSVKNYLSTANDNELFTDIEPLLKRYRGLHFGTTI